VAVALALWLAVESVALAQEASAGPPPGPRFPGAQEIAEGVGRGTRGW